MSKIISARLSANAQLIGERRGDFEMSLEGERRLSSEFPDVHTEVSTDGARYLPLKEVIKFSAHIVQAREEEYQRGVAAGRQAGREEGQADARRVFNEFSSAIRSSIEQRESLLREAESHILELTLKIARKLTFDAAEVNPAVCAQVIKGAIESLVNKREISVTVHPDHLSRMQELIEEFKALSTEIREFSLQSDPHVGYGGCFIRTPSGDIDARLASQFEIIEEAVRGDSSETEQ
ncbi:MAG: FliH/SctL family protein [Candidatus Zixiibacteriota bacterium]